MGAALESIVRTPDVSLQRSLETVFLTSIEVDYDWFLPNLDWTYDYRQEGNTESCFLNRGRVTRSNSSLALRYSHGTLEIKLFEYQVITDQELSNESYHGFFELTKLAAVADQMDLCKVQMVEEKATGPNKKFIYTITDIPSQEVLNVFIEACQEYMAVRSSSIGAEVSSSSLVRRLRNCGVYVPSPVDIRLVDAAEQGLPLGERFCEPAFEEVGLGFHHIKFSDQFPNSYDYGIRIGVCYDPITFGQAIHVLVTLMKNVIPDKKRRLNYGNLLLDILEDHGFSGEEINRYRSEAEWLVHDFPEDLIEMNIPITSQRDVDHLLKALQMFYHKVEHAHSHSFLDELLHQNIAEQDACALVAAIDDDIAAAHEADEQSVKNRVYHVTDRDGHKKIVKIVGNEDEATIENLILTEFGKHSVLAKYVPQVYTSRPLEIETAFGRRYVIVEEDISSNEQALFQCLFTNGNKRQVQAYLNYWIKALAEIHYYGTEIMNKCHDLIAHRTALPLMKDKDRERILRSGIVYDHSLQHDLVSTSVEECSTFIHQDCRLENRLGSQLVDFGHSGGGNPMLDLVRLFVDPRLEWLQFGEQEYKKFIREYLSQRKKMSTGTENVSVAAQEVNALYDDFCTLRVLYSQSQAAYLITKEARPERISFTARFLEYKLPEFEQVFKR